MNQWILAVGATILIFAAIKIYKAANRKNNTDEDKKDGIASDIMIFFFILLISIALVFWLNIGNGSDSLLSSLTTGGGGKLSNVEVGKIEREFVGSINQDIDVGFTPF